jgi:ABC-2 type transport system permease protein
MIALLGYYRAQIRLNLIVQMEYRVAMFIWMIGLILEPVIYLSVWTTVAEANGGEVGGFTAQGFAAYYIVMLVVQHMTQVWHMWEYDFLIRQGVMSARLLRPLHPFHRDATDNIAYKFFMLVVIVPAIALLALVFHPALAPPGWALAAFVPALLLAGVLSFVMGWTLALAAFWTTRMVAINQTYFIAMFFFSGQIAPLALMSSFVQAVSVVLPFRYVVAFPIELLLGRLTLAEAAQGFAGQLIWLVIYAGLMRLVWRAGMRRYTAMGG